MTCVHNILAKVLCEKSQFNSVLCKRKFHSFKRKKLQVSGDSHGKRIMLSTKHVSHTYVTSLYRCRRRKQNRKEKTNKKGGRGGGGGIGRGKGRRKGS